MRTAQQCSCAHLATGQQVGPAVQVSHALIRRRVVLQRPIQHVYAAPAQQTAPLAQVL